MNTNPFGTTYGNTRKALGIAAALLLCPLCLSANDERGTGSAAGVTSAFDPAGDLRIRTDGPLDPAEAASDWRWLGVKTNAGTDCPQPNIGPWQTGHLFGDPAIPEVDHPANSELPTALKRFCIYTHPSTPTLPEIVSVQMLAGDNAPLNEVEQDAMAVGTMSRGAVPWSELWLALQQQGFEQTGRVPPGSFGFAPGNVPRLAFIDTAPDSGNPWTLDPDLGLSTSQHGFTLASLARELLCQPNCVAEIRSRLALAYECFDTTKEGACRNETQGGFIGLIGDVARAIGLEVVAAVAAGDRLIINLSLGWEPVHGGGEAFADMPVEVKAVYEVIRQATCQGALIIAAAGNITNGPDPAAGPVYPAGWESVSAPSCVAMGAYTPMVHAVGGVEADLDKLGNRRTGGEPRLVAYADHAVVESPASPATPSGTLTGTSVATAVVSAAAAAVWYFRDTLAPYEVTDLLHDVGQSTPREAEFCLDGGPCDETRHVRVCQTLNAACGPGGPGCTPALPVLNCPSPSPGIPGLDSFGGATVVDAGELTDTSRREVCARETLRSTPGEQVSNPCPHRQLFDVTAEPWAHAQPCSQPCPNCSTSFASPGVLYLEIESGFEGTLSDATLRCGLTGFRLPVGDLVAGDRIQLEAIPEQCASQRPLSVSFIVTDPTGKVYSASSPAYLIAN